MLIAWGCYNLANVRKKVSSQQTGNNRKYLFMTVFIAGMSTLAIEFTTSRMLQTVYGTSNIVWANVIGLVLLFLTLGYFLGGRLADKRPYPHTFYALIVWAGFSSVFFLLLTSVLLKTAASALAAVNVGSIISSLLAVIFTLAVPKFSTKWKPRNYHSLSSLSTAVKHIFLTVAFRKESLRSARSICDLEDSARAGRKFRKTNRLSLSRQLFARGNPKVSFGGSVK